jgi:hypothetical protein
LIDESTLDKAHHRNRNDDLALLIVNPSDLDNDSASIFRVEEIFDKSENGDSTMGNNDIRQNDLVIA